MLMPFWPSFATQASLSKIESRWPRWLTLRAMVLLCLARLLVACVPLRMWRSTLGHDRSTEGVQPEPETVKSAQRLASHVERAAWRLPFETKCLPRAMALVWTLRIQGIGCTFKLAARPKQARSGRDDLHAWVEVGGTAILGAMPGPWIVVMALTA